MNAYFPARVRTSAALYLPRLITLGALIAATGIVTGLDRVPGAVTLGDFISILTAAAGLLLIAWGVRPEEGTEALAMLVEETLVADETNENVAGRPALRLVTDLSLDETGDLTPVA